MISGVPVPECFCSEDAQRTERFYDFLGSLQRNSRARRIPAHIIDARDVTDRIEAILAGKRHPVRVVLADLNAVDGVCRVLFESYYVDRKIVVPETQILVLLGAMEIICRAVFVEGVEYVQMILLW